MRNTIKMAEKIKPLMRIDPELAEEIKNLAKKNKIKMAQASKEIADYIKKARVRKDKIQKEIGF